MLRIRIEIVPFGDENRVRELARAELGNITAGDLSDYRITAREGVNPVAGRGHWESCGLIAKHDRRQTVWRLVERAAAWAAGEAEKMS
jgi:hypothetical protein